MSNSMRIQFEGAYVGPTSDPKIQRIMYPWTGNQSPVIYGKLVIKHKEDITVKSLTLAFKAKISCSWSEKQGNITVTYSGKKPLMEKEWVFLEKIPNSKGHVLRANETHTFDFQLPLPTNLPNALAMKTGKVEYRFTANGKRSTFQLDLSDIQTVDIYQALPPTHPHCLYPLQQSADFEQTVNYLVQIPRKAYHHGTAIPVLIRMNPVLGTVGRWRVKSLQIKIKEYFWFISPERKTRHEKRTLVESTVKSETWPAQGSPVDKTVSLTLPEHSVMTTVDTEIVKCTHKLKLLFTMDVNGSSKKLEAIFDIYVPGPFPPGLGPPGRVPNMPISAALQQQQQQQQQYQQPHPSAAPVQQPPAQPHVQPQVQQHVQPHVQQHAQSQPQVHSQPPPSYPYAQPQQPQPPAHPYAQPQPTQPQPSPAHPYPQQQPQQPQPSLVPPYPQQQPPQPSPAHPYGQQPQPSQAHPYGQHPQPMYQQQHQHHQHHQHHQYQQHQHQQPYPQPLAVQPQAGHAVAHASPFSPQTPHHAQHPPYPPPSAVAPTVSGAPPAGAAPHPYSQNTQGYPTPVASHSYPLVSSSQGYPAVPFVPSPTVGHYTLPPSPGQIHAAGHSPVPSPGITHMAMPMPSPTPVASQPTPMAPPASSPMNYPKTPVMNQQYQQHQYATPPNVDSPKVSSTIQPPLHVNDSVKVFVNPDDAVKVNLDDIKIPSTPSTPAAGNHSKNPQLRHSDATPSVPSAVDAQHSYQPPPPSSATPTSNSYAVAAQSAQSTSTTTTEQHGLSYKLSQMGLGATGTSVPPAHPPRQSSSNTFSPPPAHAAATAVTSPTIPATPNYAQATSPLPVAMQPCGSSVYSNPMSPVSAAAIGAVVASQQQYQPSIAAAVQPQPQPQPPFQQPVQHHAFQQIQYQQQQQQQQHQPYPTQQKQQVWIPMYQTIGGKTYVQYKLAA
ncbi:hypothetical protein B0O80DRAFT_531488 [Mortierella sp. GBAus27b]|nr:hypothetical protein BGX31_009069 [Mortierella sp. GBA43]KAI8350062.1 hypothetical protein B0O80DRAFT_531488 [Mortierella sp. GBAus27b]